MIKEIERLLENSHNPILNFLDEDINRQTGYSISKMLRRLELAPSAGLIDLYLWRSGGTAKNLFDANFKYRLFSMGSHLNFSEATSLYILDMSTDKAYSSNKLFPFIFNGIWEDPILINLDSKSADFESIYYASPEVLNSSEPVKVYDHIQTMMETIARCYSQGVYRILGNGELYSDKDSERALSSQLNPNSPFWEW